MRKIYLAPSLLAADRCHLNIDILKAESFGAEYIHWDIMDNKFVPNTALNELELKANHNIHKMVNDVHIMVFNPKEVAKKFIEAGADLITFHYEAVKEEEIRDIIGFIHSKGVKAGLSVKPNTDVKVLFPYLKDLDLVLVMSVEPGFGGQKFIPNALDKIASLREEIDKHGYNCLIEVDGGINAETGSMCIDAGVDILVAGSYLFGHDDMKERMDALR